MPWHEVTPMQEKLKFGNLAAAGRFSVTELCADFHVSRKTGHKWLRLAAAQFRIVTVAALWPSFTTSRRSQSMAAVTARSFTAQRGPG